MELVEYIDTLERKKRIISSQANNPVQGFGKNNFFDDRRTADVPVLNKNFTKAEVEEYVKLSGEKGNFSQLQDFFKRMKKKYRSKMYAGNGFNPKI